MTLQEEYHYLDGILEISDKWRKYKKNKPISKNHLWVAITQKLNLVVKDLLENKLNKIDVNVQNNEGKTALMYACEYNPIWVEPLFKVGADLNLKDQQHRTALMYAASFSVEATQFLLKNGADPLADDFIGWNALFFAIHNYPQLIKPLIEAGINPYEKNYAHETIFDLAKDSNPASFKLLLHYEKYWLAQNCVENKKTKLNTL